jgi:hypothetical protein
MGRESTSWTNADPDDPSQQPNHGVWPGLRLLLQSFLTSLLDLLDLADDEPSRAMSRCNSAETLWARADRSACISSGCRRIAKKEAMGIHGLLFYELEDKKVYYPTRRDEEAINPDGTRLRA